MAEKYDEITCVIDSREQVPLPLEPLRHIVKKLDCADYSVVGLEDKIAIEKKSLNDLCACVGRERRRFDAMVERLKKYEFRAIVVTADWSDIDLKRYHGQLTPTQVYGALMGWAMSCNVPIMFMGDHHRAGIAVARMLWVASQRIKRRTLAKDVELV